MVSVTFDKEPEEKIAHILAISVLRHFLFRGKNAIERMQTEQVLPFVYPFVAFRWEYKWKE